MTHIRDGPKQPHKGAAITAQKYMLEVTIYQVFIYIPHNHKLSHQCGTSGLSHYLPFKQQRLRWSFTHRLGTHTGAVITSQMYELVVDQVRKTHGRWQHPKGMN